MVLCLAGNFLKLLAAEGAADTPLPRAPVVLLSVLIASQGLALVPVLPAFEPTRVSDLPSSSLGHTVWHNVFRKSLPKGRIHDSAFCPRGHLPLRQQSRRGARGLREAERMGTPRARTPPRAARALRRRGPATAEGPTVTAPISINPRRASPGRGVLRAGVPAHLRASAADGALRRFARRLAKQLWPATSAGVPRRGGLASARDARSDRIDL